MRRLVADAAVLGTTFPAEALIAVSGRDEPAVRAALADLVRREVLACPPTRCRPSGAATSSPSRCCARSPTTPCPAGPQDPPPPVAAHLRAAFPGDGEEVADVIARHYLDALHAVPGDPDAAEIRGHAITTLIRAAERAERTGAPARAATSYATAAELDL